MDLFIPFIVGILYAAGLYLMLHRSFVRLIVGLIVFSNATNLFLFVAGGLTRTSPPLMSGKEHDPSHWVADPFPQALILTAIVIGFGIQIFAIVLLKNTYQQSKTDDLDELQFNDMI